MLIKEMVPSNTSCQAKGQVPFSLLMRTLGIFMLPRGWIGRSRPTTRSEPRHWTGSPTSLWSLSPSLSSRFRISTTTNPNSWMAHTQREFPKCLLWVSKEHAALAGSEFRGSVFKSRSSYRKKKNHISVGTAIPREDEGKV